MKSKTQRVKFRRRREQKTDYRKRLTLLKSNKPRLVVRRSLQNMYAQIIEYHPEGDKVLFSASTLELKKYGLVYGGNIPAAYLTGYLIAKKALSEGFDEEVIVDFGFFLAIKNTRMFAVIKGALDGGLKIRVSEKINDKLPPEEKITGKDIQDYATNCEDSIKFSNYKKEGIDVSKLEEHFAKIKEEIDKKFSK